MTGLHDRLMESQAETKKEKEKSKIIVTPKKDESLMETIQLFLKISQEVSLHFLAIREDGEWAFLVGRRKY